MKNHFVFDVDGYMKCDKAPNRPDDWGANEIERTLDEAIDAIQKFRKNQRSDRDELISHIRFSDLNELSFNGKVRVSEYTVYRINCLYELGKFITSPMAMALSYRIVRMLVILNRNVIGISSVIGENVNLFCENWGANLAPELLCFEVLYETYRYDSSEDATFADCFIDNAETVIELAENEKQRDFGLFAACSLSGCIFDLGMISPCIDFPFIDFCWNDVERLMRVVSGLINAYPVLYGQKGIYHILIPNLLMKSRHETEGYNEVLYKYMPPYTSGKAMENGELWCNEIHSMNDEREGQVIKDIISDSSWYSPEWQERISSADNYPDWRTYYSVSFTRSNSYDEMKKRYGSDCYGYKGSLITELIAPIVVRRGLGPQFSQTMIFDVTYDREVVKEEISAVMEFIDSLPLTEEEKKSEWVEYLQYWIFSVKDESWKDEAERRFCFFLFPDVYEYFDGIDKNDRKLKVSCSVFTNPDFVLPGHSQTDTLKTLRDKRLSQSRRSFAYCPHCLALDFNNREVGADGSGYVVCRYCGGRAELRGFTYFPR